MELIITLKYTHCRKFFDINQPVLDRKLLS